MARRPGLLLSTILVTLAITGTSLAARPSLIEWPAFGAPSREALSLDLSGPIPRDRPEVPDDVASGAEGPRPAPDSAPVSRISAGEAVVSDEHLVFEVDSGERIASVRPTFTGHVITLIFATPTEIRHGAGNLKLDRALDMRADTGDSLTLICIGTTWFEIGRRY